MVRRVTLIAGSGSLVPRIADAAQRRGDILQIIDIVGRSDLSGSTVARIPLAKAAELIKAVKAFRTSHLVLAGAVHISDAERAGLAEAFGLVGRIAKSLGDVGFVGMIVLYARMNGVRLIGAQDVAPDLLAEHGPIAGPLLDAATRAFAALALKGAQGIGAIDLGQSIVFSGDRPVAAEDAGGTDALLGRVIELRAAGLIGNAAAPLILAKALKPKQPRFVDLPSIGAETVRRAAAAGISVIVVEAGKSLVLERSELGDAAKAAGVSVVGLKVGNG